MPAGSPARMITRDRLSAQLVQARHKRCLVLQGPAGYGKTSVLVGWRQNARSMGVDTAWLALTAQDDEITGFLDRLVLALAQVDASLSEEAAQLAGHGVAPAAVERMVVTLVRGVERHPRPVMLMLDDVHLLHDARIHEALQWLLDYAPANLKLVLSSRSSIPLSFARIRAQDQLLELDLRDLRFTPAESERFLRLQLGPLSPADTTLLHELTDGWVAGLQLYAINWKKNRRRRGAQAEPADQHVRRTHLHDASAFSAFFEREVLSQLSGAELDLLVSNSVCNRFCASLSTSLSSQADDPSHALALLARLDADNLFLISTETGDGETWYRIHPLLRETLSHAFQQRAPADRQRVHRAAWQWFSARGLLDEAVGHAVCAGESTAAADMVEQAAQRLAVNGELRKLMAMVRQLPHDEVLARPRLRLWMLRNALYANDFAACMAGIAELRAELDPSDAVNHFALVQLEASLAVQRDDIAAAMALLEQLQQTPSNADVMTVGSRDNILSWLHLHRGDYERARMVQLNNPSRLIAGTPLLGTSSGVLQGRCLIGLSLALQGYMTQAERVYRDVLYEAQRHGSACTVPASLAATLLGEVLYELNEPQAVLQLLEDRVDVLERVSMPDSVLRMLYMLSASHWLLGRQQESFAYLDRLEDYALERGADRLLSYSLTAQAQRHLDLRQTDAADALLQRLDTLDSKRPNVGSVAYNEAADIAARVRIRWLVGQGELQAAHALIQAKIPAMNDRGRRKLVAQLLLLRARIESLRGQHDAAIASTVEALQLGQKLGLLRSLLDTDPAVPPLIAQACRTQVSDPVLQFYSEKLLGLGTSVTPVARRSPAGLSPPLSSALAQPSLSERELDILRLLAQTLPNKKIARALGLTPETVKWHLKNIYSKLGVSSRDDAVARMRELQWREPPSSPR